MDKGFFFQLSLDEAAVFISNCVATTLEKYQSNFESSTNSTSPEEGLLQIQQICELFNISKATVHGWKKKGQLPFHRIGRRIYFKKSEVIAAMKSSKKRKWV